VRPFRERLPLYYRIAEKLLRSGRTEVAVPELAAALGIPEEQVADDMGRLGLECRAGISLETGHIRDVAEHLLGLRPVNTAVLVGVGRLGAAIASYEGFHPYGMRIVAIFDSDEAKAGHFISGLRIMPMEQLEDVLNIFQVRLAVLTVPPDEAQEVATRLIHAGVQAIWNFAPRRLELPENVVVRNEDIAAGLSQLCRDLRIANLRRLPPEESPLEEGPPTMGPPRDGPPKDSPPKER
jgi:redox-sensing transcriptional repressor